MSTAEKKTDPVISEITVSIDASAKEDSISKAVQTVKGLCAEIHNQKFYSGTPIRISYKVTVR